ncbi:MAG TPA: hypothetical protein DHW42_07095 [Candidatus Marinimicrobia bacterium]|nr:hypothetical protein [Candidatus Neomarinimicrobiota bacterium]
MKKIYLAVLFMITILLIVSCSQEHQNITGNEDENPSINNKTLFKTMDESYSLVKLYKETYFYGLIGTYWTFSNIEETGDYCTQWVYTNNINYPIPNPKSCEFIGGGRYVINEKILDVSFIEWECGIYNFNNPEYPNDQTEISWYIDNESQQCNNGNAWSTALSYYYGNNQQAILWPDKICLHFYVDVSSICPSAHISGPIQFPKGKTARFYATVNGGFEPYDYQWWIKETDSNPYKNTNSQYINVMDGSGIRRPPTDVWIQAEGNEICDHYCYKDFYIKCVVTDANGYSDTSNILFVDVTESDVLP